MSKSNSCGSTVKLRDSIAGWFQRLRGDDDDQAAAASLSWDYRAAVMTYTSIGSIRNDPLFMAAEE